MREGRHTILGTFLTRDFVLVLDPTCIERIPDPAYQMVHDLACVNPPVRVTFLIPTYLVESNLRDAARRLGDAGHFLDDAPHVERFRPSSQYPSLESKALQEGEMAHHHMELLGLVNTIGADGLIADIGLLSDQRHTLYEHHMIRVIPTRELFDFIGLCARGHSLFWTEDSDFLYTHDVFYLQTHWKLRKYQQWFFKMAQRINNSDLVEELRNLFLNRFAFLLYSCDMVQFYQIQRDHYIRRNQPERIRMAIAYHLNHFYLLLWGLLDQLTVIAKHALNLDIQTKYCGIQKDEFWKKCKSKCPALVRAIKNDKFQKWIDVMADIRHPGAHRAIPTPQPLLEETEESTKPKEEVREIVLKENEDLLAFISKRSPDRFEETVEMMIDLWRTEQTRRISDGVFFLGRKDEFYTFRDPLVSIDFDLERGFAICDAFLIACFSGLAKSK